MKKKRGVEVDASANYTQSNVSSSGKFSDSKNYWTTMFEEFFADFNPIISESLSRVFESWFTRGFVGILVLLIFCCDIVPGWLLVVLLVIFAMVWSFLTGRKTSYQPAKRQYSVSTNYNSINLLDRYTSSPSNQSQQQLQDSRQDANQSGHPPFIVENHRQYEQDDNDLETTSTSSAGERHHLSLRSKEPLDAVTLSAVTSPGFTSRLARRNVTTLNPLRECNVANLSISPNSKYKNSPTNHLQLGQLPPASWKQKSTLPPPSFPSPINTSKFSLTRRKRNESPGTTYVHFAPVDVVMKATSKSSDGSTPPGIPSVDNRPMFGMGGFLQSPIGVNPNNSRMQKLWSPPMVLDTSSIQMSTSGAGVSSSSPNCSIGDTMFSRKRNRLPDVMLDSRTSAVRHGSSSNYLQDDHLKQNSKRTKYIQSPSDLRFGTTAPNQNLPFMALPNLQTHDDESMTSESILEQLKNQTEKRFLPEDDTLLPSKSFKKTKISVGSSKSPTSGSGGRTPSPYRKRRIPEQLITSLNEEEEVEKVRGFCSCSECYNDAAGFDHNRSISPSSSSPNASSSPIASKKKKNVTFDESSFSLRKDDSNPDVSSDHECEESKNKKKSSSFAPNIHVITKNDYDIDKQRRLDRLNHILNESYRSGSGHGSPGRGNNSNCTASSAASGSSFQDSSNGNSGFTFGSGNPETITTTTASIIFGNGDAGTSTTTQNVGESSIPSTTTTFGVLSSSTPPTTTSNMFSQEKTNKDDETTTTETSLGQPPLANNVQEAVKPSENITSNLFTFGAQTTSSTIPTSIITTTTTTPAVSSGFSFSSGQQQPKEQITTSPSFAPPASTQNSLNFGGQPTASSSGTFSFGLVKPAETTPASSSSSIFGNTTPSNQNPTTTQSQENNLPGKTTQGITSFGVPSPPPSVTATNIFGQESISKSSTDTPTLGQQTSTGNLGKETNPSGNISSNLFSFGGQTPSSTFSFGGSTTAGAKPAETTPSSIFGSVETTSTTTQNQQSKPSTLAASTATTTFGVISPPLPVTSNIFGQGSVNKDSTDKILGQVPNLSNSGNDVASASGFAFGALSNSTPVTQTSVPATTSSGPSSGFSFTFGGQQQKDDNATSSFGQVNAQRPPPPAFGQVSSPPLSSTFGGSGAQSTSTDTLPKFGSQITSGTSTPIFGQSNTAAPAFGSGTTPVPIFGAPSSSSGTSTPTFGQSNNSNNTGVVNSTTTFGQVSSTSASSTFGQGMGGKGLFGQGSSAPTNSFTQGTGVTSSTNVFGHPSSGGSSGGFTLTNPGTNVSFGQSNSAVSPQSSTQGTSSIFGQGSPNKFGQGQSLPNATSPFGGQSNTTTSPFGQGATSSFGGQGNNNNSSTTIPAFGQSTSSPHIFGQQSPAATSPFGGGAQSTSGSTTGSGFGLTPNSTGTTTTFGQSNLFGNSGNTPSTFGQASSTTSGGFNFGGNSAGAPTFGQTTAPGSNSTFGNTGNKPLFGQSTSTPSTFAFGQPQAGAASTSFNFNSSSTTSTGLSSPPFGGGGFNPPQSQTGGLNFGGSSNTEQQPSQPASIFQFGQPGQQQPQAPQQGGFSFNQQQPQPFGSPQQQQQQPSMFNLGSSSSSARRRETRTRRFR